MNRSYTLFAVTLLFACSGLHASLAQNPSTGTDSSGGTALQEQVAEPRLAKVAVLGASLSAGFGLSGELDAKADFALILDSLIESTAVVRGFGDSGLFMSPTADTMRQLEAIQVFEPSIVFGADLMFWFAYGPRPEAERGEFFELGLSLLSKIETPLVLGDIPDMRFSLEAQAIFGLRQEYVPTVGTLSQLNARLVEWAKERENVTLVPLAQHVTSLRGDKEVTVHGNTWMPADLPKLLQSDLLHPTVDGSLCTGLLMLDALNTQTPLTERAIEWDVVAARTELFALTAEEREKAQQRKAKAAERKARREQRRKERAEKQKSGR